MKRPFFRDALFSIVTLVVVFVLNLLLERWFHTQTMIPMIFVLGVFLISWQTQGYFWGIAGSLVSVLMVNYAFTSPYYAFDLISPECVSSAAVMLIVSVVTSMLTTQIKRQQQIKAEMDRERMRVNLLRAVSHDLRTPLTAIYGASSTVVENYHELSREQHLELLEDVRTDSQWLIRMVENLLTVTRIDGQRVHLAKTATVLEELVGAVLVKFRKHYPQQQVQLQIPEEFVSIPMDAMLIQQVLMNLLENAVLHAKGMSELSLRVVCRNGRAEFSVADNGCGIPAERLEELFTGYLEQRETPSDGSRNNMGIGLSVCSAIIRAHGSEITVENNHPHGTVFRFSLEMEETNERQ